MVNNDTIIDDWLTRILSNTAQFHVAKAPPYSPDEEGIPPAMLVGDVDEEGWGQWQPLPSTVSNADIDMIAQQLPAPLPPLFRAFLRNRFVLGFTVFFDSERINMMSLPSDNPLREFRNQFTLWEPLIEAGFFPFADYGDGYGPVCFDLFAPQADGDCPVLWIDHEAVVDIAEPSNRASLLPLLLPLCPSFRRFMDAVNA